MVYFRVASERQIYVKQISNRIAGATIRATVLRDAVGPLRQFIFDVMTDQATKLEIVWAGNFREIVLPNKKVLVILPGRLVPKSRIPARAPVGRKTNALRLWENGRKLGSDLVIERRG